MNIALVLSGGKGTRIKSSVPKQYIQVAGKMILNYSLDTLMHHPYIDAIQLVAEATWVNAIQMEWNQLGMNSSKIMGYSHPGATRQLSILQGLKDIQMHVGMDVNVLIHDGARPWLSVDMITRCMKGLEEHEGIMPVLPMKDTIYMSQDGCRVSELLDRQKLYAGQSPEAFRMEAYYKANQALMPERILKINGSTEPAILAGLDVGMIPGEETNYKITTDADLKRFQEQIEKGL